MSEELEEVRVLRTPGRRGDVMNWDDVLTLPTRMATYHEAITLALGESDRRHRKAAKVGKRRAKTDPAELAALDETRRVILTALCQTEVGAEIAATVVNALTYHSHIIAPVEGAQLLDNLKNGVDCTLRLRAVVNELCVRRGDEPMFADTSEV